MNQSPQMKPQPARKKRNQSIYVAAVAVLMVLSIVIAIVSATSRRKPEITPTTGVRTEEAVTPDPPLTKIPDPPKPETKPKTTESDPTTPAKTDETPVAATLPTFRAPVDGTVMTAHSHSLPVFSSTMSDYRVHGGVDIEAALGDPVFAAADGTVGEIWEDPMMGTCMSVSHSGGALSIYKNLAPELPEGIAPGAFVKAGDTVAAVGESALIEIAEEPHLHYELHVNSVNVDPQDYMDFPTSASTFDD